LFQGVETEDRFFEYFRIRFEPDFRSGHFRRADHSQRRHRAPPFKGDLANLAVPLDLDNHFFTEGVHDGYTHAMQAAGNLVAGAAEFSAGVKNRQHHFHRRFAGFMHIHRNSPAIIGDGNRIILVDHDIHFVAIAGQRLIDAVVHDFIHQMVQAFAGSAADIHPRPFPDCFQSFQNLNLLGAIISVHYSIFIIHH